MENQCTFCLHTCHYCLQNIFNLEIQAHLNVCECLPLDCVNQCGLRILRKEMFSHITDDCFNTLVPCQYINIGCNYKEMRKYTDAHAKTSAQNHLSLALTKLTLLEKNFDSTEKEKEEMKQQLLKLKRLKDTKTQKHVEALVEQIYSSVRNQSFVQLFISFCKKCSTKELRIGFLLLSIVILLIKVFHSFLQEYPFWITKVYLVFCFIENNAGDIHKLKNKKTVFSIIFWSIVVLSICVIDNCLRGYLIWSFGIICTICVINGLIKDIQTPQDKNKVFDTKLWLIVVITVCFIDNYLRGYPIWIIGITVLCISITDTHTPEDKETVFDILLSSIVILTICVIDNFLQGYPVWIIGIIMAVCVIDNICKEMYISKVEDMNFRIIFYSTAFLKLCFFDYCLRGYPFWMNGAFFYCIIIWGNPVTDKIITKQRSHAIIFWFILILTTCVFDRYLQGYPIWMFGIILIAAIAIESIYGDTEKEIQKVFNVTFCSLIMLTICVIDNYLQGFLIWTTGSFVTIYCINDKCNGGQNSLYFNFNINTFLVKVVKLVC
ncbi:uncharacterized protein LOC136083898 [Hydra vulgaris]|uniref:Uncharacterized protein LOC136083898 n=1 Tax=Hydra vulgaris TaxID=6087 RepID=A0ABM4CDX9_HYDVU